MAVRAMTLGAAKMASIAKESAALRRINIGAASEYLA